MRRKRRSLCWGVLLLCATIVLVAVLVVGADEGKMDFIRMRKDMVARTIVARGIHNSRVVEAMNAVKREEFVAPEHRHMAYEDNPLPIGHGQTISQPYIVALMADAMRISPDDKVLEVGTGCGYAAAVLAHLAKDVYSIERIAPLAEEAKERLQRLGYKNVYVSTGDGTMGWAAHGPYNAIGVAAGAPSIPKSLVNQLAEGGRIVIPVENPSGYQDLIVGTKQGDQLKIEDWGGVRFVPLIGAEGYRN